MGGEDVCLGPVEEDSAIFEEDDAVDFGDDVVEVVGDEKDADAGLGEVAKLLADFAEGWEVEAGGGFVEEEGVGVVNEGAGDEEAAGFAGREFVEPAVGQVSDFEAGHGLGGGGFHFG